MKDLETIIRLAIDFEGRTAYPVSEYDERPLKMLISIADMQRVEKHPESRGNFAVSSEIEDLADKMNAILKENPDKDEYEIAKQCVYAVRKAAYGDRADSNLDKFGYDMVFAATLGSIDAVIKEYMDKASKSFTPEKKYYIESIEGDKIVYKEADAETATALDELNLFAIPDNPDDRTPEQKEALNKAYDKYYLAFGFKAAIGIPSGADVDKIIDFDPGETGNHTKVKYNMYFKELSIIQFTTLRGSQYLFNNFSQGKEAWCFKFNVDLGLIGVSLDSLPENIKEKVVSIDPSKMFSINQLFLDLNTTALLDRPVITGVQPDTDNFLNTYFVNYCLDGIRKTSGNVVLGYSVTPDTSVKPVNKPYILQPRDFRFYVSPYRENNKPAADKKHLYTLNYLIISEDKPFPALPSDSNPLWNWVDEAQYKNQNGALSISKTAMHNFAKREYAELIKNLLFKPSVNISINDPIYIHWSVGISLDQSTKPVFSDKLTYEYTAQDKDSDTFIPLWSNGEFKYTLKAAIRNYQSQSGEAILECRVDTVLWAHINVEGGVSEGTTYDKTTWYTLSVNVDENGKLSLKPRYKEEAHNTTFSLSGWSTFVISGLEDYINNVNKFMTNSITANEKRWNQNFLNHYNNNALWYIPGDGSLIFKQPQFSNDTDLTFAANYATPK